MANLADIQRELSAILDPEMPINIVDLGLIAATRLSPDGAAVQIDLTPTFVGCPALQMLQDEIRQRIGALPGVRDVKVTLVYEPAWSVERITTAGRAALRAHGVTVPAAGTLARERHPIPLTVAAAGQAPPHAANATAPSQDSMGQAQTARGPGQDAAVNCPFCASAETALESAFGPTRCRMIYYCRACRNTFEHLKPV